MNMRATYTFTLPHGGEVTFYIHHDGYPEGAAQYLLAAHLSDAQGTLADRFNRANARAVLTARSGHADVQFAYTIASDGALLARERSVHDGKWMSFESSLHYAEFINLRAPPDVLAECGKLKSVRLSVWTDDREWVTRAQLIAWHAAAIEALESYRARFPGMTGNIQMRKCEVAMLEGALDEYDQKGTQ